MGIDLWFRVNISAPRPPILKVQVLKCPPIWGFVLMQNNPDFRFNRMKKSGETEFFEVHREKAVITHLNSVFCHIPHFFLINVIWFEWGSSWPWTPSPCKAFLKSMKGMERERPKSLNGLFLACTWIRSKKGLSFR